MPKLATGLSCAGCTACVNICPKGCISITADNDGFLYPTIDEISCVNCDRCRQVCPVLREIVPAPEESIAYAAINTEDDIRQNSTSGGVFTCLGQWVLERGGVVFGSAYDDDFNVVHCPVEKIEDLQRLRGAKYVQSSLGDTYRRVQICLKEDRYVLFSGTPCQVGGLVSFLGKV